MKKFVVIIMICFSNYFCNAQEIGIRWGKVVGNDVALDALFSSGEFSRIHGDVSFGTGVGVDILFDFLYRPLKSESLNWYAGVGPTMLIDDPFLFGVSGEAGLEYRFSAPISISADWRPTFYLIEDTDFDAGGFGLNVRYVFGK